MRASGCARRRPTCAARWMGFRHWYATTWRGSHERAVVRVRQPPAHYAEVLGVRCRGLLDLVEAVGAGPVRDARTRRGRSEAVEPHGVAGADRGGGRHRGETAAIAVSKGRIRVGVLVNFRPSKRRIEALCRVPGSSPFNKRTRG